MKIYLLSFLLILAFVFSAKITLKEGESTKLTKTKKQLFLEHPFDSYIEKFNKNYEPKEYKARKDIYIKNLERIKKHNEDETQTWKAGENQFTDWTKEEFHAYLTKFTMPELEFTPLDRSKLQPLTALPVTVDWRDNITSVKDQGSCGGCWSFSAVAVAESAFKIHEDILMDLSQQQLISCQTSCSGCNGGVTSYGLNYIKDNGACGDYLWGYAAQDQDCSGTSKTNCESNANVFVTDINTTYIYTLPENERVDALMQIVATYGSVGVAIDADSLSDYDDGIATWMSCSSVYADANHAVTIVGYGTDGTTPFWRVKNSWGTGWGENGFFRFARGSNICGIENIAYFVEATSNGGLTKFTGAVTGLSVESAHDEFTLDWDSYPGAQRYFVKAIIDGELFLWETSKIPATILVAGSYGDTTCWVGPILDSQYGALGENITFNSAHSLVLSFFAFLLILFNFF
ncbi:cathepsin l1 [Anaeramoeba ignava]|uniref:Cathepsin l1 n=1 Tax=Anaeramoeba ignava TaxID=1746090 RepID=A0A9Q0LEQ4_ANAIG|nr:cathepsin l1 [Anaeramoeba ignava]